MRWVGGGWVQGCSRARGGRNAHEHCKATHRHPHTHSQGIKEALLGRAKCRLGSLSRYWRQAGAACSPCGARPLRPPVWHLEVVIELLRAGQAARLQDPSWVSMRAPLPPRPRDPGPAATPIGQQVASWKSWEGRGRFHFLRHFRDSFLGPEGGAGKKISFSPTAASSPAPKPPPPLPYHRLGLWLRFGSVLHGNGVRMPRLHCFCLSSSLHRTLFRRSPCWA